LTALKNAPNVRLKKLDSEGVVRTKRSRGFTQEDGGCREKCSAEQYYDKEAKD
jgi:hypothetical protein